MNWDVIGSARQQKIPHFCVKTWRLLEKRGLKKDLIPASVSFWCFALLITVIGSLPRAQGHSNRTDSVKPSFCCVGPVRKHVVGLSFSSRLCTRRGTRDPFPECQHAH